MAASDTTRGFLPKASLQTHSFTSLQSPLLPHLLTLGPQGTLTPDPEPTLLISGHFRHETGFYKERREWTVFLTTQASPLLASQSCVEKVLVGVLLPAWGKAAPRLQLGRGKAD